jgi:hypothetical protein
VVTKRGLARFCVADYKFPEILLFKFLRPSFHLSVRPSVRLSKKGRTDGRTKNNTIVHRTDDRPICESGFLQKRAKRVKL